MSALSGLFQPGGQTYRTVPDVIDQLPKGLQHRATVAWKTCMRFLARGFLDERATDRELSADARYSESFIQSGLHALDVTLREMGLPPLIERVRARGRRTIIPAPLAGRGTPLKPPPSTPPEEKETATTDTGSSSSLESPSEKTGGTGESACPELIARACKLVRRATPGRVVDAVAVYGEEWVGRALDRVEERNRKPGNKPVESWGFVLNTLANWRKEGGPPALETPTPAAPPPDRPAAGQPVAPDPSEEAEKAREKRLREAWGLLPESEREAIRAAVKAENPGLPSFILEENCVAELGRRLGQIDPHRRE